MLYSSGYYTRTYVGLYVSSCWRAREKTELTFIWRSHCCRRWMSIFVRVSQRWGCCNKNNCIYELDWTVFGQLWPKGPRFNPLHRQEKCGRAKWKTYRFPFLHYLKGRWAPNCSLGTAKRLAAHSSSVCSLTAGGSHAQSMSNSNTVVQTVQDQTSHWLSVTGLVFLVLTCSVLGFRLQLLCSVQRETVSHITWQIQRNLYSRGVWWMCSCWQPRSPSES